LTICFWNQNLTKGAFYNKKFKHVLIMFWLNYSATFNHDRLVKGCLKTNWFNWSEINNVQFFNTRHQHSSDRWRDYKLITFFFSFLTNQLHHHSSQKTNTWNTVFELLILDSQKVLETHDCWLLSTDDCFESDPLATETLPTGIYTE
jgi:hypothetical protein